MCSIMAVEAFLQVVVETNIHPHRQIFWRMIRNIPTYRQHFVRGLGVGAARAEPGLEPARALTGLGLESLSPRALESPFPLENDSFFT